MSSKVNSSTSGQRAGALEGGVPEDAKAESLLGRWPSQALLRANLAGLAEQDKGLAQSIGAAVMPDTVEMAVASDGSVSFRFRQADGRRNWLGFSSTPVISAEANLKRTDLTAGNIAMNGIGHGGDARAILEKTAAHQALLVVEADPLMVNLVFQLHDFSKALRRGRLVILIGRDVRGLLSNFYAANPGYNIISQTIAWTWLSSQENQQFAQQVTLAMEEVTQRTLSALDSLLAEQQADDEERVLAETVKQLDPARLDSMHVANCTNTHNVVDYCTSRDALAALRQLGVSTDWLVLDRPDEVSHMAQLARLNRLKPDLILLVDSLRGDLGLHLPRSRPCATLLRSPPASLLEKQTDAAKRFGSDDFIFAEDPGQVAQCKEAGFPDDRVFYLAPAANTELFCPVRVGETDRQRYGGDVVLVADRFSTDPETYQIRLPSHQTLWRSIIKEIQRSPGEYHPQKARQYLVRAQHCGVTLRENDLRKFLIELVTKYLGYSVMLDSHCGVLKSQGINLRIRSWSNLPEEQTDEVAPYWHESELSGLVCGTISHGAELNKLYNVGKIHLYFPGGGQSNSHLLNGMAAGAFFLVKAHPPDRLADTIGKMFQLGRELITFASPKDLLRKVGYFLAHPEERQRIAQAGREKVLAHHNYQQRMREMLGIITSRLKGQG